MDKKHNRESATVRYNIETEMEMILDILGSIFNHSTYLPQRAYQCISTWKTISPRRSGDFRKDVPREQDAVTSSLVSALSDAILAIVCSGCPIQQFSISYGVI